MSNVGPFMLKTTLTLAVCLTFIMGTGLNRSAQAQNIIQVRVNDSVIRPGQMVATSGQPLNITVMNQGKKVHNFVIPDFYIFTQNLNPGEQVKVSFTPSKTGVFPYYSDTGGRPEPGLRGTLQVRD